MFCSKNNESSILFVNEKSIECAVGEIIPKNINSLHVDIIFNDLVVQLKVDSGAAVSTVHPDAAGVPKYLMTSHKILKGPHVSELRKFLANLKYRNINVLNNIFSSLIRFVNCC